VTIPVSLGSPKVFTGHPQSILAMILSASKIASAMADSDAGWFDLGLCPDGCKAQHARMSFTRFFPAS
jgi:hypothetical protein